jgi:hypothetical protein
VGRYMISASPPAGLQGYTITVTLTGQNTNWVNGATQVTTGPGIAVINVVVTSATTLTAQFVIAANAVPGPYSLTTTGGERGYIAKRVYCAVVGWAGIVRPGPAKSLGAWMTTGPERRQRSTRSGRGAGRLGQGAGVTHKASKETLAGA